MKNFPLLLALILTGTDALATSPNQALAVPHSVSVQLPVSTQGFAPGAGAELAGKCLICHSAEMVTTQPRLTEAQWKAEINKMRNVYGAPIADDEVDRLTAYMTALNAAQPAN
jgi:cytochrome c553